MGDNEKCCECKNCTCDPCTCTEQNPCGCDTEEVAGIWLNLKNL